MSLKTNYLNVFKTSKILDISEDDVMELLKHGFLSANNNDGELMVSNDSVTKYQRRFGSQKPKQSSSNSSRRDYSLEECSEIFGCEKEVHKLIQSGELEAIMYKGSIKILGASLGRYLRGDEKNA